MGKLMASSPDHARENARARAKALRRPPVVTESILGRRTGRELSLTFRAFHDDDCTECSEILKDAFVRDPGCSKGFRNHTQFLKALDCYSEEAVMLLSLQRSYRIVSTPEGIVGIAGFIPSEDRVNILDVAVSSSERGEGIGFFLMNNLLEEINCLPGVRVVWLHATYQGWSLYERFGFDMVPDMDISFVDGAGNVYMEKNLTLPHSRIIPEF